MVASHEMTYLERCLALAEQALEMGDMPFGSVLVNAEGDIVFEDRNRVSSVEATRHPEFEIARWAAANLSPEARAGATVYTSGEHCPMCSTAHGLAGLGRIVYISSSAQLAEWETEWGAERSVAFLPIQDLVPNIQVDGPVDGLDERVRALHRRCHGVAGTQ